MRSAALALVSFAALFTVACASTTTSESGQTDDAIISDAPACPNGTVVSEARYLPSADDMECRLPRMHCITKDPTACPLMAQPAVRCDGTIKRESTFVPSADGMECEMPQIHCLTKDFGACPQVDPIDPAILCPKGEIESEPFYVSSADGMECAMTRTHCLTKDLDRCPVF